MCPNYQENYRNNNSKSYRLSLLYHTVQTGFLIISQSELYKIKPQKYKAILIEIYLKSQSTFYVIKPTEHTYSTVLTTWPSQRGPPPPSNRTIIMGVISLVLPVLSTESIIYHTCKNQQSTESILSRQPIH